jgi:sugar-specific transcriptional regulator TrmB
MNNNYMVTAQDVVEMLGVSKGHAYKIIRHLNP